MDKSNEGISETELKYFNIINSILDIVVELDLDYKITYINSKDHDLLGYSKEELIEKQNIDIIHPDDFSKMMVALSKTIKTGEIITEDIRYKYKNGPYIPVSVRGRRVKYDDQIKIVLTYRDITQIKEIELKAKESDKKYREIINNIEDGYYEIDLAGNYTYVNDYTCRYLGISREKLLGTNSNQILDKNTREEIFKIFSNMYEKNLPKETFESQVIRNDGKIRTFEGIVYLKYNSSGDKVGFYGFTHDITEKKEAEEKLKKSEERYKEAYNRAELYKDIFYHDINNIFSNIKLSVDLSKKFLSETGREKDIEALYDIIQKQFVKGAKLLANVGKVFSLDQSKSSLKSIDALKKLNDAIKFIHDSFHERNINIKVDSVTKKIHIQANELLYDVFDNLLINAITYNNNSNIEILIKITKVIKNKINYIKFLFQDNGIGIAKDKKDLIFHERSKKEKGSKGLGFGLTLVKKIINNYNGEIWVEDKVSGNCSHGSNFIILIPEAI
ncbi:MAG: Signal transduction histidine kinase [Candidatus Lokiarchaeum sp. GC14_75]|nr:MAG: Signal transduction histidine kinase [Candidatus Lokiarchaeum sp. GC14_75]